MKTNQNISFLMNNISAKIVGKEPIIENMIVTLLAGGHVLLEDVPGVGKTTLARTLAASLNCSFARIQCTPDTMPGDITGVTIYNMKDNKFETVPGPVVNQIVIADELNRTSPKTQAALLEAMQERQVTIDNIPFRIPEPFMVIGTQNPSETTGTYPLPEAELDRFMMRMSMGYPGKSETLDMVKRFLAGDLDEDTKPVLNADDIILMKQDVLRVKVDDSLIIYATELAEASRKRPELISGLSPRAVLSFVRCAQARAYVKGRNYVVPDDLLKISKPVLSHRLILSTKAKMERLTQDNILELIMKDVKIPEGI